MAETENEIDHVLALLETVSAKAVDPPVIVVSSPDSDRFIIGNQGGLIRLAIASLKAAKGEKQSFKGEKWILEDDLDWVVKGLELDQSAHIYLPEKKTRTRQVLDSIWGYAIVLVVSAIVVTGLITTVHWLWRLISH